MFGDGSGTHDDPLMGWAFRLIEEERDLVCLFKAGSVAYINAAGLRMLKCQNSSDVLNRSFSQFAHPDYREALLDLLKFREDGEERLPIELVDTQGQKLAVELTFMPLGGFGPGTGAIRATDITERKYSAEALVFSENRHRELTENSRDLICTLIDDAISYINPAGLRILQASTANELVGRRFSEFVHDDYRDVTREGMQDLVAEMTPVPMRLKPAHGEPVDVEISVERIEKTGEAALMVVCHDITLRNRVYEELRKINEELELRVEERTAELRAEMDERKCAEDARRNTETLLFQAQKMKSLGSLAGGMSHEFKNILLPILGLSEMTMNQFPEDSREHKRMAAIVKSARRGNALVEQVLSFSRLQDERNVERIALGSTLAEVIKLLRSTLLPTIEVSLHCPEDEISVMCASSDVQQIVMNLGANAADAMEGKGGKLDFLLEMVEVGIEQAAPQTLGTPHLAPGAYAKLTVCDTGCGMDAETLSHVFDPFFTTKEVGEGTGMGLAIVHGIVCDYGGGVGASSVEGEGATFEIFIPIPPEGKETP